jgi:hypothetical protein
MGRSTASQTIRKRPGDRLSQTLKTRQGRTPHQSPTAVSHTEAKLEDPHIDIRSANIRGDNMLYSHSDERCIRVGPTALTSLARPSRTRRRKLEDPHIYIASANVRGHNMLHPYSDEKCIRAGRKASPVNHGLLADGEEDGVHAAVLARCQLGAQLQARRHHLAPPVRVYHEPTLKSFEWRIVRDTANSKAGTALTGEMRPPPPAGVASCRKPAGGVARVKPTRLEHDRASRPQGW